MPRFIHRHSFFVLPVLLVPAALLLTGCTPPAIALPTVPPTTAESSAAIAPVDFGTCLDGTVRSQSSKGDNPDITSVVACSQQHKYEVIGLIDLPSSWVDPKADVKDIAAQIDDLVKTDGAKHDDYQDLRHGCYPVAVAAAGFKLKDFNGVDLAAAQFMPLGNFWVDSSIPPAEQVKALGRAQITCAIAYAADEYQSDGIAHFREVISPDDGPLITSFLTADFPNFLRVCDLWTMGSDGLWQKSLSTCTGQHTDEMYAMFDARAALGATYVAARLADPDYGGGEGSAACSSALTAGGDLETLALDWSDFAKSGQDVYWMTCAAAASDSEHNDLSGGSVWGGGVDLVPIG